MSWSIYSTGSNPNVGTGFHIVEGGALANSPFSNPPVGTEMPVEHSSNARTSAKVIERNDTEMVLEMKDGTKWKLTPATATESQFMNIKSPGLPSADWMIREKM